MNEFGLIEKYFRPLTQGRAGPLGLRDDAAVLKVPDGHELVVTSDTLSAGVHFLAGEKPEYIAHKSLRVNLSDLAAMAAEPYAYQLCIAFPGRPEEKWVKEFCAALLKDQKEFGIFCSGGDTTVIKGPLTISITAFGIVPKGKAVKRSGAKPGDALVITGPVGDALAGLRILQNPLPEGGGRGRGYGAKQSGIVTPHPSPPPLGEGVIRAYRKPVPRTVIAKIVRAHAHAAIDISDGLIADVGHICEASGCAAKIELEKLKFSKPVQALIDQKLISVQDALTGGDDYELALAVQQRHVEALLKKLRAAKLKPQVIGTFTKGKPVVRLYGKDGREIFLKKRGWTHF